MGIENGIKLSSDQPICEALKSCKKGYIVIQGPRLSGKTSAIKRVLEDNKQLSFSYIEAPKVLKDQEKCEQIQNYLINNDSSLIIDGSTYIINYIKNGEFKNDFSVKNKSLWVKTFNRDKPKIDFQRYCTEINFALRKNQNDNDIIRIIDYLINEGNLTSEQQQNIRTCESELIELSMVEYDTSKYVIIPLLKRQLHDIKNKNKEQITSKLLGETNSEKYLCTFFGLTLFGLGAKHNSKKALPAIIEVLAAGGELAFGSIVGLALLGVSSVFGYVWEKKESSFEPYLKAHKAWNNLPFEKKMAICDQMDERFHLPPNSSFDFLSSWLGKKNLDEEALIEQLKKINRQELKKTIESYEGLNEQIALLRKELYNFKEDYDAFKKEITAEIKTMKVFLPFQQYISILRVNISGETELEDVLSTIANVKIKINGLKIPFICSKTVANDIENMEKNRETGLYISGLSGSGKSRIVFEAIKNSRSLSLIAEKATLERIKASLPKSSSEIKDISILTAKKDIETTGILIWDNFPDGLVNPENPFLVKSALEIIASFKVRKVISLNPQFYAKYAHFAADVSSLSTISLKWSKEDFSILFKKMGRLYLGEAYLKKVQPNEESIIELLFTKWGLPKPLCSFFAVLNDQERSALMIAKELKDEKYGTWLNSQFRIFRAQGNNLDFLFTIKLAGLLGIDNLEEALDAFQREVFNTKEKSDCLDIWYYRVSGRCFMHDSDLLALDFDISTKQKIFAYIKNIGFGELLSSRFSTLDEEAFKRLGCFIFKNAEFYNFRQLIEETFMSSRLLDPYQIVGYGHRSVESYSIQGFGEAAGLYFSSFTDEEKELLLEYVYSRLFTKGLGVGLGLSFNSLSDNYKDRILDLCKFNTKFSFGMGIGIGRVFDNLPEKYKIKAIFIAGVNPEFKLLWGIGSSQALFSLTNEFKDKILEIMFYSTNNDAIEQCSIGQIFDDSTELIKMKIFELISKNPRFAKKFMFNIDTLFSSLSMTNKLKVLDISVSNPYITQLLSIDANDIFDSLSEERKKQLLAIAKNNSKLAKSLVYNISNNHLRTYSDIIIIQLLEVAKRNSSFAKRLGFQIGYIFSSLSNNCKERVVYCARIMPSFGTGFGFTIGGCFGTLSDEYQTRLIEIAEVNLLFSKSFGWSIGKYFTTLDSNAKTLVLDYAKKDKVFNKTLKLKGSL